MQETLYHIMPDGRKIAFRQHKAPDESPSVASSKTLVFLPGYMSDMAGGKASALFAHALAQNRSCLLLDYSGCGESSGDFADGTLSKWCDEVLALINAQVNGDIVLAGSSMGGWLMLLVGAALGDRLSGIIGIASAPDFTRWGYDAEQRAALQAGQLVLEDNPYGPEPTPTYPGFFKDAEQQLMLNRDIPISCPVRLLHGQKDADVPWQTSLDLAKAMRSDDIQVTLIKDGDHRLSRESDIALLLAAYDSFY